jgi:hypothetical protein
MACRIPISSSVLWSGTCWSNACIQDTDNRIGLVGVGVIASEMVSRLRSCTKSRVKAKPLSTRRKLQLCPDGCRWITPNLSVIIPKTKLSNGPMRLKLRPETFEAS